MQRGSKRGKLHGADGAQWVLYVVGCLGLMIPWYLLLQGFGLVANPALAPHTAGWLLTTGVVLGLLYRSLAQLLKREPSLWFALLVPLVAVVARAAILQTVPPTASPYRPGINEGFMQFGESFIGEVFVGLVYAYTCGGIFVLPMAIGHVWVLRQIHRRLERWTHYATRRSVRHCWYAIASVALVGFTDLPPSFDRWQVHHRHVAARQLAAEVGAETGLEFPADAECLSAIESPSGNRRWWIHAPELLSAIDDDRTMPLTEPDRPEHVVGRLDDSLGVDPKRRTVEVTQWKLKVDGAFVCRLVRTSRGDFMEVSTVRPALYIE